MRSGVRTPERTHKRYLEADVAWIGALVDDPRSGALTWTDEQLLAEARRPPHTLERRGASLHDIVMSRSADWDPRWRALVAASDPSAALALAVRESLEFMNDDDGVRRPFTGPLRVAARRSTMRVVDHLPPVRPRMAREMQKVRDSELV